VAQAEQTITAGGRSSQTTPPAGPPSAEKRAEELPTPQVRRPWPLWVWPPVAITFVAVGGYVLGTVGALIAAGQAIATLIFVAGDLLYKNDNRRAIAVTAVAVAALVVTVLLWQTQVPWLTRRDAPPPARTGGPVDLRGQTVTAKVIQNVDLRGSQLSGAGFDGLDLRDRQLDGAVAAGTSFQGTRLSGATLRGADLRGANLARACLTGADITGADLTGVDVSGADLTGLSLSRETTRTFKGTPAPAGTSVASCQ
jgi:hypothetical protein